EATPMGQDTLSTPSSREIDCSVEQDTNVWRVRNHVVRARVSEDLWVCDVERFLENRAEIPPAIPVAALRGSNLAAPCRLVHHFTEDVPLRIPANHEWIGHKRGRYVGDIFARQHGVRHANGVDKLQR